MNFLRPYSEEYLPLQNPEKLSPQPHYYTTRHLIVAILITAVTVHTLTRHYQTCVTPSSRLQFWPVYQRIAPNNGANAVPNPPVNPAPNPPNAPALPAQVPPVPIPPLVLGNGNPNAGGPAPPRNLGPAGVQPQGPNNGGPILGILGQPAQQQ